MIMKRANIAKYVVKNGNGIPVPVELGLVWTYRVIFRIGRSGGKKNFNQAHSEGDCQNERWANFPWSDLLEDWSIISLMHAL